MYVSPPYQFSQYITLFNIAGHYPLCHNKSGSSDMISNNSLRTFILFFSQHSYPLHYWLKQISLINRIFSLYCIKTSFHISKNLLQLEGSCPLFGFSSEFQ